jgi:hypothetical protein
MKPLSVWLDYPRRIVRPPVAVEVRRRYAEGEDDEIIGDALGVSARLAKRLRHALGLLRAPTPHAPVADSTLVRLHRLGLTYAAIAAQTGLTHRTVQERASRLGLRAHRADGARPSPTALAVAVARAGTLRLDPRDPPAAPPDAPRRARGPRAGRGVAPTAERHKGARGPREDD